MYNESTNLTHESEPLILNELAIDALSETRKWTTFLAVLGAISTVIMLLAGLIVGLLLPKLNVGEASATPFSGWVGWTYLIMSLINIIPLIFIFRFNGLIKKALQSKDNQILGFAFSNLNLFFRTIGIITIVIIVLYIGIIGGAIFFSLLSF
ncbi:MAG: hypothetical protein KUL83_00105 [Lentimicrobium sp.]|jgi:hypothetical protein|nr:hypothetical protein [Lentimicrobium sp.]MDD2527864.1 hypothetical protein [Lentimicrobiaceae bacterium]MDD4596940.1 hypothetical protein [Lentimicrobiaceae bacterium]MDY0024378.1 hypothetical protein [Lentimicrobium sp.]HAH56701.1 hypothetical protein [Bacteroidales bacterium]